MSTATASVPLEDQRAITLMQLPDDALAWIALHLPLTSLVDFACTCKLAKRVALADTQFKARLVNQYNLGIQAIPSETGCYDLYHQLHTQAAHGTRCRFQAVSTDGGVDGTATSRMVFWVDNMFADDHDESYCSEIGGPITTFGLLLADEPEQDINRKQRGRLARLLLETPLQLLRPSVPESSPMRRPLHLWSLPELESLLSEFWGPNIAACGPWLAGSFGPAAQELQETTSVVKERARDIVYHFRLMRLDDPNLQQAARTTEEQRMTPTHLRHPHFSVAADPQNPRLVYDIQLMPRLLHPPHQVPYHIAVLSQVSLSRKGGFSCPVRTGAVLTCVHAKPPTTSQTQDAQARSGCPAGSMPFLGQCFPPSAATDSMYHQDDDQLFISTSVATSKGTLTSHAVKSHQVTGAGDNQALETSSVRHALANLTSQAALQLQQCRSFEALEDAIGQKDLPPVLQVHVHRSQSHFSGVTVEFEAPHEGCTQTLSPLLWFQFFSKEEDAALRDWEHTVLKAEQDSSHQQQASTSSGTPGKLPAALSWVKRVYNPRSASVASARAERREPSHPSTQCNQGDSDDESVVSQANSFDTDEGTGVGLFEADDDAEEPDAWSSRSTQGRNKLNVRLFSKRPANLTSVLLIDQENLMELWRDMHPEPNIDVSYIRFHGSIVKVPAGTKFTSNP